jgi:hypothetical protein
MIQGALFPPPPRRRPRKLMRVVDAGEGVNFVCPHCGYDDGWSTSEGLARDKRARPCPRCAEREARRRRPR